MTFKNKKQISAAEYQTIKTPITTDKHGGGTKALATFGFGLLGYAASSGVKTEVKTEKIKTQMLNTVIQPSIFQKNMWILILQYPEKITLKLF